jgi:hypothetical protein
MAEQLDISLTERQRCAIEFWTYNSSVKSMETMQWYELRFSSGGSALETKKRKW